ncbi:MAG: hypothetical protein HN772_01390 [Euryarchaeota archaeon]|jgi:hypothetical protein|nr:hypothetical protein [Euryarchaeota archaeon]
MVDNNSQEFKGGFIEIIHEIFSLKESNLASAFFFSLILIMSVIHTFDWQKNYYDDAIDAKTEKDWAIEFEIETLTSEYSEVWQDEEIKVIDFLMEDFSVREDYYVGAIFITIIPDAADANLLTDPLYQCDAIAGDIEVNDLTAQWNYEGNNLSGQDSSCENIYLNLQIYPEYSGNSKSSDAPNEFQALMPWNLEGWGEGTLSISIELDVNSVDQLGPVTDDDDEEITILVEVHTFNAKAKLNN